MRINIRLRNFVSVQFGVATIILILGALSYLFGHIIGHPNLLGFLRLLDVGSELSIPTYFSVINLLLSSILLFIVFQYEKKQNNKGWKYWFFLSILFLFLSIDESASIHENFAELHDYLANKKIIPSLLKTHQWLPFGLLFIVILGISLFPFYHILSKRTFRYFIISGLIFTIGAIGFESMGALMLKTGFVESRRDPIYLVRRLFEEGFEMYGIVLFNCALFLEISNRKIYLNIDFSK